MNGTSKNNELNSIKEICKFGLPNFWADGESTAWDRISEREMWKSKGKSNWNRSWDSMGKVIGSAKNEELTKKAKLVP